MAITQDWKIRASTACCAHTGAAFADGETFYTSIFEDIESEGFIRRDYSANAWSEVKGAFDPPPFSFWKSAHKAPPETSASKGIVDTSAEGMLRRFIEEDDPRTENARFILALMLERKKTLVPVDAKTTETRTLLFYEHEGSGEVFIVADPGLKLDEIEAVQAEVSALLAEEERRSAMSEAKEAVAKEAEEAEEAEEAAPTGESGPPPAEDRSITS